MAVYGFTDAELRRTELIGNRTVTRKQLLEALDAAGSFQDAEHVTGEAQTTVEFLGMKVGISVSLSFTAWRTDVCSGKGGFAFLSALSFFLFSFLSSLCPGQPTISKQCDRRKLVHVG